MRWDIFCKVIDNHGDLGVCWRLSAELAARGDAVRLWVDDASALAWMAPGGRQGVQVLPWDPQSQAPAPEPGDAVIE
ncbi:MAG: elongation factor maturation arginine rhamnosyltransferase EarP, partial [Pseudomonadota bacterium]